jgi:hypothetical protein
VASSGESLPLSGEGNARKFTLPRLGAYEVVVLE